MMEQAVEVVAVKPKPKVGYPKVIGEFDTVRTLKEGFSIARAGDGECKMAHGDEYVREKANPRLAHELKLTLRNPSPSCLIGVPTMDKKGPKFENWDRHRARLSALLSRYVRYYSAFITRPDSAPWIDTLEYAELLESLWSGKKVALICEPQNKMLNVVKRAARKIDHIACPRYGAFALIDQFEHQILSGRPDISILCVGPTATCLANRLSNRVQTLDLGSAGGFLSRLMFDRKLKKAG